MAAHLSPPGGGTVDGSGEREPSHPLQGSHPCGGRGRQGPEIAPFAEGAGRAGFPAGGPHSGQCRHRAGPRPKPRAGRQRKHQTLCPDGVERAQHCRGAAVAEGAAAAGGGHHAARGRAHAAAARPHRARRARRPAPRGGARPAPAGGGEQAGAGGERRPGQRGRGAGAGAPHVDAAPAARVAEGGAGAAVAGRPGPAPRGPQPRDAGS
mmetsp:Transcript_45775/g.115757  ORF Transcript_45775/g.115757 Transcript_45775/m.115757 type:complete len:209 (+) Transcript_45775:440-1066(+)